MNILLIPSDQIAANLDMQLCDVRLQEKPIAANKEQLVKRYQTTCTDYDVAVNCGERAIKRQADCAEAMSKAEAALNRAQTEHKAVQEKIDALTQKITFNQRAADDIESRLSVPYKKKAEEQAVEPALRLVPEIVAPSATPNKKFYQTTTFKVCLAIGLVTAVVGAAAIFMATPVGFALAAAALVHLKVIALILLNLTLTLIKAALAFGQSHVIPALIAAFNFCKAHPIITIGIFVPIVMLVTALEVFAKTVHNKSAVSLVVNFFKDKLFTKKSTETATRPSAISFRLAGLDAKTAAEIAALPSDDPRFIKEYNDRFVL